MSLSNNFVSCCCSLEQLDEVDGSKYKPEPKRHRSVSECYFVVKGAALILPHDECIHVYRKSTSNGACDIQRHLKSMFYLLREDDTLRMAVKLESMHSGRTRYLVVVSCTSSRQDREECCLLGVDCANKTTIGLVLPVWADTHITLDGDGGFSVSSSGRHHIFKPVSVQAMWSALQTLHKASAKAREYNYYAGGSTHNWIDYYDKCIQSDRSCLNEWHAMDDLVSKRPPSPDTVRLKPTEREATEKLILTKLKELMMSVDLDEVTSKFIRTSLEDQLDMNLNEYKSFIDQEMLTILGQMDAPTKIFEYLYLGSEWNASNLEELKANGVDHILNVTREIDNFFPGMFDYLNVRVYDDESTEMLKHWDQTFKYIRHVKSRGQKVLVHCKMGISRSASVVIAYVMKAYDWNFEQALDFVKNKRNCIKPNQGFVKQLEIYQGILDASKQRHNMLWRSKSETNLQDSGDSSRRNSKSEHGRGGSDKPLAYDHLNLPGSISRPKSWSPDDSLVESIFPSLPFDKPFEPLKQCCGTDPSFYLNLESTKKSPNMQMFSFPTPTITDATPPPLETSSKSISVHRVSSIKDRINELESQSTGGNSQQSSTQSKVTSENKLSQAASKSGLVLNLATQFETASKPNTPTPEEDKESLIDGNESVPSNIEPTKNLVNKSKDQCMQNISEPVVSQTKPPVAKHQAVLVRPHTWPHDTSQGCIDPSLNNVVRTTTTTALESSILLGSEVVEKQRNQAVFKKPSHSERNSLESSFGSPKNGEGFLWSRQSSSSSTCVTSSPTLCHWPKDGSSFTEPTNVKDLVLDENLKNLESSKLERVPISKVLSAKIPCVDKKIDEVVQEIKERGEFSYEKEDIPWTPGTVRRTRQKIESNTLRRTTSYDSAFPSQSSSPTPTEVDFDSADNGTITRSHSLHSEGRPRSTLGFPILWLRTHDDSRRYRRNSRRNIEMRHKETFGKSLSHSLSTPSVVEAVNQVLCGTKEMLKSAMSFIPNTSKEKVLPGIVKQNRLYLEGLSPKNVLPENNFNLVCVKAGSEEKSKVIKPSKKLLKLTPIPSDSNLTSEEVEMAGGVVKRLTQELEAKSSPVVPKKEIEEGNQSALVSIRLQPKDPPLRKTRTLSDETNQSSCGSASTQTPQPLRSRKTSLDLEQLKSPVEQTTRLKLSNPILSPDRQGLKLQLDGKLKNPSTITSTGRPPLGHKVPFPNVNIPIPPPMPPPLLLSSDLGLQKKGKKLQQGKSHPLSKLTVKQRHANPLYNTM